MSRSTPHHTKSKKFWEGIFEDKEKLYYILAGVIFVLAMVLLGYFLLFRKNLQQQISELVENTSTTSTDHTLDCPFKSALSGQCVENEDKQFVPLVGVMIENFIEARPQAGIAEASVVYEAPAEGNITRFLALFEKDQDIAAAGPVRSARPYYLDWISEYPGALYMHVGGSPDALEKLDQYKIFDVDEFYRGIYFWRDEKKFAPHNAFTSSDLWKSVYDKYADKNIDIHFDSWKFAPTSTCETNCISEVEIPFLRPSYIVKWRYNAELHVFERFHSNTVHVDSQGTPVRASTLIVQHVTDKILDEVGRRALGTVGEGTSEVYMLGYKIDGTWKKESRTARTKFFDSQGKEIPLTPGKIWIEVVPNTIEVTHTP